MSVLITSLLLLSLTLPAAPQGRVNDYAGMLAPAQEARLEAQLRGYEGAGPQIVVVTLPSLEGEVLEDVSLRLAERWRIGSRADDGVLLLVAQRERALRIEVGYGAEARLPDALAARIIREVIAPRLQEGQAAAALSAGVAAIHQALSGQEITGRDPGSPVGDGGLDRRRPFFFGAGGLLLMVILFLLLGRGRGGGFLFGLLLGSLFGGRRGGGDGGGFSGGGGSFGGGGASGRF